MRQKNRIGAFWLTIAATALVVGLVGGQVEMSSVGAAPLAPTAGGGLVTHVHESEGRATRVIIVDPLQRVLLVYDIGRDNGQIQLKSVRNLSGDLRLQEYNSGDPSPIDILKQLERQ